MSHQSIKTLPVEERRNRQQQVGLVTQVPQRREPTMNNNQETQPHHARNASRAQRTLENMSKPLTFAEVAQEELKRAAVIVPMLLSTGVTLLWINKKFFAPKLP